MRRPALGTLAFLTAAAAGLAACNAEGAYERAHGVATWSCWLGNPNAGVYNLWLGQIIAE